MSLSQLDKAYATLEFILKKKKRRVDDMGRKVDLSENQKIFMGEELDFIRNVEVVLKQSKQNVNEQLGKLPPQALDMEVTVLGAIMLESRALGMVIEFLRPEHFYSDSHRAVFTAILGLSKKDSPVDLRTVVAQLRKDGMLEAVGGAFFIAELQAKVSSSANIEYHARYLVEMAMKRRLIMMGGKVMQDAYLDTSDVFDMIDFVEEEMKAVNEWTTKPQEK